MPILLISLLSIVTNRNPWNRHGHNPMIFTNYQLHSLGGFAFKSGFTFIRTSNSLAFDILSRLDTFVATLCYATIYFTFVLFCEVVDERDRCHFWLKSSWRLLPTKCQIYSEGKCSLSQPYQMSNSYFQSQVVCW